MKTEILLERYFTALEAYRNAGSKRGPENDELQKAMDGLSKLNRGMEAHIVCGGCACRKKLPGRLKPDTRLSTTHLRTRECH